MLRTSKRLLQDLPFGKSIDSESCTAVGGGGRRKASLGCDWDNGQTRLAEVHWYEAHGIGRKEPKIKRYID
jgi:hypothetical protein